MAIDQIELGRRLQSARVSCGLTQEFVAEKLGLPRTAVVNIESGDRSVSTLELTKMAELYRRSLSEFLYDTPTEEDIFVVLHRLDEEFADSLDVQKEVSNHVAICRAGHDLKELLGIADEDGPPEYHAMEPQSPLEAIEQGNLVATHERRRLSLGSNPLPDLAKLIAAQSIWAAKVELPDKMSGMFLHHPTFGSAILVNEGHPLSRRRFSFCHEYAHALLDRQAPASISSSRNRRDLREVRANSFAAAFLLPAEGVHTFLRHRRKTLPSRVEQIVYDPLAPDSKELVAGRTRNAASDTRVTYQDVASLMTFFRTSYQATCYRLKSLNLVGKDELEDLLRKEDYAKAAFELLNMFDGDPNNEEIDSRFDKDVLKLQVVNLVIEAYRRAEVSKGKLRDISYVLEIGAADLLKLAEMA